MKRMFVFAFSALALLVNAEPWTIETNAYIPLGYGATDDGRTKCDYVSFHNCSLDTSLGKVEGETQNTYYGIGSTKAGSRFEISLANETADDYVLSYKVANGGSEADVQVSVTSADYGLTNTYTQVTTGGWYDGNAKDRYFLLNDLPTGNLTLCLDILSTASDGAYAGNYGYFKFSDLLTVALAVPGMADPSAAYMGGNKWQVDNGGIGYVHGDAEIAFTLAFDEIATYGLSFKYGTPGASGTMNWSLADGTGTEVWSGSNSIAATGAWTPSKTEALDFGVRNEGIYILTASFTGTDTSGTSGYLANFGDFTFTKETLAQCTVSAATIENATLTVTSDGLAVKGTDGVYSVNEGADVVVTYTANDGYEFENNGTYSKVMTFTFDDIAENKVVTAPTAALLHAQWIATGQYVQLASTSDVWPSPEADYHNKCNSEDYGKRIGSSYQGSWFRVDLYNPTAGDYALEFKGGVSGSTTEYSVVVSNETGYVRNVSVSQRNSGSWTAEDDAYLILDNMPAGDLTLYFEVTYCSTGSYAGNYGYFKFTSIENMRTLTTATLANASVTVRRKSVNNAATTALLSLNAEGKYFILDGWDIVVEYTADDRYYLDGTSTFEYTVSGNIDMSSSATLPEAKESPVLTLPARTYATATVLVDDVETAVSADGKYHFAPGSQIMVKYRGDIAGEPYGQREYVLVMPSVDYTLADGEVPLYYRHEFYMEYVEQEGGSIKTNTVWTPLLITDKLTGNRDVVLYSGYNTDFILDCDWSELTGTVSLEGSGNFKFGPNWKGAASSHWIANTGLYLYGRSEGGSDSALGGALAFGTYVCTGQKRFYMFNGEQNLTMQFGGGDDFEFSANCGIGGYFWNGNAHDKAGVKVVKTGACKMTTNLAGAREWEIANGEVEFVPLTATEANDTDGRDMYVKLCTNMTVKAGAAIGGFYGPKPELGLDGHGIEKLVFEDGTTFKPYVGDTWVVTNATISGTLTVAPVKKGALVNGVKYTLLTAENGITDTLTDNVEDDFTVAIEGNSIIATYNGMGAWVVGNGETLVYSGAVTNGFATTSEGIIIEDGGRMVVDCTAIEFPADGTLTLPSVQLPEGATATDCISVKAPSGTKGIPFMADDGYGYWTFATREGRSSGFVIMIK